MLEESKEVAPVQVFYLATVIPYLQVENIEPPEAAPLCDMHTI